MPEQGDMTVAGTSATGTWHLVIDTPVGTQHSTLELSIHDGVLRGVVRDDKHDEAITLTSLSVEGDRLTWTQAIRKPIRLTLAFDVAIEGDELSGRAKGGRPPSSRVTGWRTAPA